MRNLLYYVVHDVNCCTSVSDLQRVLDAKHHHSRSARRLSGLSKDEGQEKEGVLLRGPSGMLNRMSSLGFLKRYFLCIIANPLEQY